MKGCIKLSGLAKPANQADGGFSGKFNFKVKISHTDLACGEYLFGTGINGGFFGGESPLVYQNSGYISKLYFINNYSGGILAKDRIEDMPEKYRWFMKPEYPTEAEMIKSFEKKMVMLANREEVGQNVFYSTLSNPANTAASFGANPETSGRKAASGEYFGELGEAEYAKIYETLTGLREFGDAVLYGENDFAPGGSAADNDAGAYYEGYGDDEEIRSLLNLNTVYNSELYKMSKVEYDFSAPGDIRFLDDGSVSIKYDDGEMTGLPDSYMQMLFRPENRDIIIVRRKNMFEDWVALEKGRRISFVKTAHHSDVVVTTSTKELSNGMTLSGGDMRIAYTTETDGIPTESVVYSIKAEKSGAV